MASATHVQIMGDVANLRSTVVNGLHLPVKALFGVSDSEDASVFQVHQDDSRALEVLRSIHQSYSDEDQFDQYLKPKARNLVKVWTSLGIQPIPSFLKRKTYTYTGDTTDIGSLGVEEHSRRGHHEEPEHLGPSYKAWAHANTDPATAVMFSTAHLIDERNSAEWQHVQEIVHYYMYSVVSNCSQLPDMLSAAHKIVAWGAWYAQQSVLLFTCNKSTASAHAVPYAEKAIACIAAALCIWEACRDLVVSNEGWSSNKLNKHLTTFESKVRFREW